MSDTIRWGIASTGWMAQTFVKDFQHVDGAEAVVVGSRDLPRAQHFAQQHGIRHAVGSYRELCARPDVDVVYIATPHPQHKAIALEAIANGKAVLVEKSFTATLEGTKELVQAARDAKVFAMEAVWTRFQPAVRKLHEIVDQGQLGTIRAIQGEFFAHRPYDPSHRLFAKDLGGGALLDLGIYPVAFAHDFLGMPSTVLATGTRFDNGVDAQTALALSYGDGAVASLGCSLQASGPNRMMVVGEGGYVELDPQFFHTHGLSVHRQGVRPKEINLPPSGTGYSHEIEEVSRCVREGRLESDLMPLQATVEIATILDDALRQLGISYHEDDELN